MAITDIGTHGVSDRSERSQYPDQTERPRILIVDDHRLFADVLSSMLMGEGMEVLGTAPEEIDVLRAVHEHDPDLVIMDMALKGASVIDVGSQILRDRPHIRLVLMTALGDAATVKAALRAGFSGYLTKDIPVSKFLSSIRAVLAGDVVVPQRLVPRVMGVLDPEEEEAQRLARYLTRREVEVLSLLVEGAGSSTIAESLCVSVNTVRTHIQNILTKLQVHTRLEAAAFATRNGIVSSNGHRDGIVPSNGHRDGIVPSNGHRNGIVSSNGHRNGVRDRR